MTTTPPLKISVIIPVGNAIDQVSLCLEALKLVRGWDEVILVVSGDDDFELAQDGARVVSCPVDGRSFQANMGAAMAEGDALVFLPVSSLLPKEAMANIREALKFPSCAGGGFALGFEGEDSSLTRVATQANRRGNKQGLFLWEQVIFVRREVFERVGGFSLRQSIDDFELCEGMAKRGTLVLLYPPVISASKGFAKRGMLTQLRYKVSGAQGFSVQDSLSD